MVPEAPITSSVFCKGNMKNHPFLNFLRGYRRRLFNGGLLCLLLTTATTRAQSRYTVSDLGTLGGKTSLATGVNNRGEVIGQADLPGNTGSFHAFIYKSGKMEDLGTFGGSYSTANGINDIGEVVGDASILNNIYFNAFLYRLGNTLDIGAPYSDSSAEAINDCQAVVGEFDVTTNFVTHTHAFLYSNGHLRDLGTLPGGTSSNAFAINNRNQVAGYSDLPNGDSHAFLYSAGIMHDLGTLGSDHSSVAYGINDHGQVVGYSYNPAGGSTSTHAFLYSDGRMQDLGTLGGSFSYAVAINNRSEVVGTSYVPDGSQFGSPHAFIYSAGRLQDLNTLILGAQGLTVNWASSINDAGQIAAYTTDGHALLLTPFHRRLWDRLASMVPKATE
jgi:probable HAF family extracellular repeat protein